MAYTMLPMYLKRLLQTLSAHHHTKNTKAWNIKDPYVKKINNLHFKDCLMLFQG